MGYILLILLLPLSIFAQLELLSQNKVYRPDCKIKKENIKPFVSPLIPYINNYRWYDNIKTETFFVADSHKVIVSQQACIRHHIVWEFQVKNGNASNVSPAKLFKYAIKSMDIVFYNDMEYSLLREFFLKQFMEKFKNYGVNELFYFDFADDTYLFKLILTNERAVVKGEVVRFLYKEKIKLPGIKEYLDDGWFRPVK